MPTAPVSLRLLRQVATRLRCKAFGWAVYRSFLAVAGLYLIALVASRLTGWCREYFDWSTPSAMWVLLAVPGLAVIVAAAWHRRPRTQDAARAIDTSVGAQDLYLTLSLLESAAGEYQPLVLQEAESRAVQIRPSSVVPFGFRRRHGQVVWLALAIALAGIFVPQLDPFGKVAQASLSTERKDRLAESRRETRLRVEEVKKAEEIADESTTDKVINDLKLTFNKMQPQAKQLNLESLMDEQKRVGAEWKKLATDQLQNLIKQRPQSQQQIGAGEQDQELMEKWKQDLQSGSTESLKEEMQQIKSELQKLAKTQDPVKKEELRQQVQERLERLEKFAQKNLENKKLASSVQRAMKQMDLASMDELSSEALEGAMESLDLSEMEMDQLAQSAEELKKLEEALKTLQMAKKLNDHDKLDGQECQSCKTLAEYKKLYQKRLAECQGGQCKGKGECEGCSQCQGNGNKSGGQKPGNGTGSLDGEDIAIETDFDNAKGKSAVNAGKVLLSMKSKGMGERGPTTQEYQALLEQVQQGTSEAILQEEVPPAYHESIKGYFDALKPAATPKPTQPSP